jgi:hypothetical protein
MWRDIDPRAPERERPEPGLGRVGGYTEMESGQVSDDPRDAFTRDLDLPRGSSRDRVRVNDREYRLSGDDVRVLATVGAFRVVPAGDRTMRATGKGVDTASAALTETENV